MSHIGLDIGGTSIKGVLLQGNKIMKECQLPTLSEKSRTIQNIIQAAKLLMQKDVKGIGISLAGRTSKGLITFNPNIKQLVGVNLKQAMEKSFGKKTIIENDAACFALAESRLGLGRGKKNVIGLIIGTGIGAGIIIDGRLYKGNGAAGEIGHMIIDPTGHVCGCGRKGDFESWCSGKGIVNRYTDSGGRIKDPDPQKIYFSNEHAAKQTINETIEKMGIAMANISAIFDPEIIVLGGGVSNLPFYSRIRKAAQKHKISGQKPLKIEKSRLKMPGAVGAALLF